MNDRVMKEWDASNQQKREALINKRNRRRRKKKMYASNASRWMQGRRFVNEQKKKKM